MTPRVAILGTGRMGSAFANRLSTLHPLLWNRTRATADQLRVGRVVDTAAEAVAGADIVITSVTGATALRNLFSGPTGALSAASGQLFIEMSTAGPDVVQELADSLRDTGASLIDAPVLGSPAVVKSGGAAILVGGAPADMERGRQVLEMLGEVRLVGPLGSGARLKLIGNSMLATLTLEAAELQVAGEAAGLDPSQVFWAVSRLAPGSADGRRGILSDATSQRSSLCAISKRT